MSQTKVLIRTKSKNFCYFCNYNIYLLYNIYKEKRGIRLPYYPKETIEKINQSVPMMDLMKRLGESVKRSGKTGMFLCQKCGGDWTNSRININKNFFKCFKCEAEGQKFEGRPVNYIQEKLNLCLPEAVEYLSKLYSIPINDDESIYTEDELKRFHLYKLVSLFYHRNLDKSDYLLKRGISKSVQKRALLGYAPGGSHLVNFLRRRGYSEEYLKKENIMNQHGKDMFYQKAVFPVIKYGKVIDIYTRSTNDFSLKHMYLNGKDIIYGHDQIEDGQSFIDIYEGFIDELAVESFLGTNGIAIGGINNFTNAHIQFIKSKKPKNGVRIILDGDPKGQGQLAAFNISKKLDSESIRNWVVVLPIGEDPASLLVKERGAETYQKLIDTPLTGREYRRQYLLTSMPESTIALHLERRRKTKCQDQDLYTLLYSY